jgi:hypothetical protein
VGRGTGAQVWAENWARFIWRVDLAAVGSLGRCPGALVAQTALARWLGLFRQLSVVPVLRVHFASF